MFVPDESPPQPHALRLEYGAMARIVFHTFAVLALLLTLSPARTPAADGVGASDSPPATPPDVGNPLSEKPPASDFSARRCLRIADDYLDECDFRRAAKWYRTAGDRAQDKHLLRAARRGLARLKILGKPAPALAVVEWVQGKAPKGATLRGKVILLTFFQVNCPQSRHAIQFAMSLTENYAARGLEAISIATATDEHAAQSPEAIRQFVTARPFNHRVAIDRPEALTFRGFGGESTPLFVLIDRDGRVRWLESFDRGRIERKVLTLLAERVGHRLPGPGLVMPTSRGGRDLIGRHVPRLKAEMWMNTPDGRPPKLLGRPRLIRFFTDGCRFCRATIPALNRIHHDFADKGLLVVGIYHPKPGPRDVSHEALRSIVQQLEVQFPATSDPDWRYLHKIWLDSGNRDYTSVSLLIDRKGVIRYVHPGPEFFASADPTKARQNEDYLAMRRAIEKVLSE